MKLLGFALLQLDSVSPDTALSDVKKDIHPNTQFFDSLSFQPLNLINELIQRGNQYAFLEDDLVVAATKRTVASTFSDSQDNNGGKGKGKRSQHNRDTE